MYSSNVILCTEPVDNDTYNTHLQTLLSRREEWTKWTIAYAARNGHLECLKYLHQHGCVWTEETLRGAVTCKQVECLKYAYENGCPFDIETVVKEIETEHRRLMTYGGKKSALASVINSFVHVCEYALEMTTSPIIQFKLRQFKYQLQLNDTNKLALSLYFGGYYKPINKFLLGELFPMKKEPKLVEYSERVEIDVNDSAALLTRLAKDINTIIQGAPRLKEETKVYRGVKTPYFLSSSRDKSRGETGFISTSLEERYGLFFSGGHYILEAMLDVGTACLFWPLEKEILLPLNTQIKVERAKATRGELSEIETSQRIGGYSGKIPKKYIVEYVFE